MATSDLLTLSQQATRDGGTPKLDQTVPAPGLSSKKLGDMSTEMGAHNAQVACKIHSSLLAKMIGPQERTAKEIQFHRDERPNIPDVVSCGTPGLASLFTSLKDRPSLLYGLLSVGCTAVYEPSDQSVHQDGDFGALRGGGNNDHGDEALLDSEDQQENVKNGDQSPPKCAPLVPKVFPGALFDPNLVGPPGDVFPSVHGQDRFVHRTQKNMFLVYPSSLRQLRNGNRAREVAVVSGIACVYGPPSHSKPNGCVLTLEKDDGVLQKGSHDRLLTDTVARHFKLHTIYPLGYAEAILQALVRLPWDGPCEVVIALENEGAYKQAIRKDWMPSLFIRFTNNEDLRPSERTWALVWKRILELAEKKIMVMFWHVPDEDPGRHLGRRWLRKHTPAQRVDKEHAAEYFTYF